MNSFWYVSLICLLSIYYGLSHILKILVFIKDGKSLMIQKKDENRNNEKSPQKSSDLSITLMRRNRHSSFGVRSETWG